MMDERPCSLRIYTGELREGQCYTTVLATKHTTAREVIQNVLEKLSIFEDSFFYNLYEGRTKEQTEKWQCLDQEDYPLVSQAGWKKDRSNILGDMQFHLFRKPPDVLAMSSIVDSLQAASDKEGEQFDDLCLLTDLSEQSMLTALRTRFEQYYDIYTYVGSFLIAINPYFLFPMYNPKYTNLYQGRRLGELPPHIFAIADDAYNSMLNDRVDQTVIISGESGSGKTESTKFLLHHMMSLSSKLDDSSSLELITLGTGPVLEAFGNAKTISNDNSSRFGKFILVSFRENGAYYEASIEKYLLEKSRIISQAPGERNYHVFYYLLAGADSELKTSLCLSQPTDYYYLGQGTYVPLEGVEEVKMFGTLVQSLGMLGFSPSVQLNMFTLLAAILHLGNILFKKTDNEDAVVITHLNAVHTVSSLLKVEESTLYSTLTTRRSQAGGDWFVTSYKPEEAVATRDAMAKALYGALFDWIVDQVNYSLAAAKGKKKRFTHKGNCIGVLDIFGFEVFQKNSFEQFCINYANEQLHQYFNKHVFKSEQEEYMSEGIKWCAVGYTDNYECLELIAGRPTGLLSLLDEECSFPGADDSTLFTKFERQHKGQSHYRSPQRKLDDPVFTILHYAGAVVYHIQGFREKNRDLMRQDIVELLKTSRMDLVRALIGLPSVASSKWRCLKLTILAVNAFQQHGRELARRKIAKEAKSGKLDAIAERHRKSAADPLCCNESISGPHSTSTPIPDPKKGMRRERVPSEVDPHDDELYNYTKLGSSIPTSLSVTDNLFSNIQRIPSDPLIEGMPASEWASIGNSYTISGKQVSRLINHRRSERQVTPVMDDTNKPFGLSTMASAKLFKSALNSDDKSFEDLPPIVKDPKIFLSAPRVKLQSTRSNRKRNLRTFGSSSKPRKGPAPTVSAQFHTSLLSLMERLEQTHPYFVRCIKSNSNKTPKLFDSDLVLRQLRYTGMLETIRIRKAGYSVRVSFEEFYEKYQFLIGKRQSDLSTQIGHFLEGLGFSKDDIQIGHRKVFMRDSQKFALQNKLEDEVLSRIVLIQRWVRAKLVRCRYLQVQNSIITIQAYVRGWFARKVATYLRIRVCCAVIIQTQWRCYSQQRRYHIMKRSSVAIQSCWRGYMQRRRYAEMLDEQRRRLEEERQLEEVRRQEEERKLEEQRRLEEQKRIEEEKRLEDERRLQEQRLLEEERRLEEQRRLEEEKRLLEEDRLKELKRQEELLHREAEMKKEKEQQKEEEIQKELEEEQKEAETNVQCEQVTPAATVQGQMTKTTSVKQQRLSKDMSGEAEDDEFEALMKGLTESLDALDRLAEEGHKIYDTLRLKKRPPPHNSMITRKKSLTRDSGVESKAIGKDAPRKRHSLKHRSSSERTPDESNQSRPSVKERQKQLTTQSGVQQHRPLQRTRANSETVMALEQASSVKRILASMNASGVTTEPLPQHPTVKLKRSSPVLTKKVSSQFPDAKCVETPSTNSPLHVHGSADKQTNVGEMPSTTCETTTEDLHTSEDELFTSERKLNRKRSTLSKRLSASADNVLHLGDDIAHSSGSLTRSKEKASRSKSTENLSFKKVGSARRKQRLSVGSPVKTPPTHDGNKLISLAQGILTNFRIPRFTRQQSGSEPPVRLSWYVKVYDGTNELENKYSKDSEPAKDVNQHMTRLGERSDTPGRQRHRNKSSESGTPHFFKAMNFARFVSCAVCKKPFSGFLSHGVRCQTCDMKCHRHCAARAKPCSIHLDTSMVVNRENEKVVTTIDDVDKLGRFLFDKISLLGRGDGVAERLFRTSLQQFHTNLISQYSLAVQETFESFLESIPDPQAIIMTFDSLMDDFTNIMKGVVGKEGSSNSSSLIQIGVNQFSCFLDEFIKSRNQQDVVKKFTDVKPRKLKKKKHIPAPPTVRHHRGHKLEAKQFNVLTVCEACDQRIPVLGHGMVCRVCGYTCHEECHKNVKKCPGLAKKRPTSPDNVKLQAPSKSIFGMDLASLVPPNTVKVPLVLERCLNHIEVKGLFIQGIYRKPPSAKNKRLLKEALEQDPQGTNLDSYDMHCITSIVTALLGQLSTSLISPFLYKDFIRAAAITNMTEKLETLHRLIDQLPELNHTVFERIIFHLARVAQQEEANLMSPNNLGIIFAPILLKPPYKQPPQELLLDLPKQTSCIECIIIEQVEKLKVTLHEIEYLTSAAQKTASLIENIMESEKNELAESGNATNDVSNAESAEKDKVLYREQKPTLDKGNKSTSTKKIRRLTLKLEELERERTEWTLRLSKLEHLSTSEKIDETSQDDKTGELCNGSKEPSDGMELSPSDTDDDFNNSRLSDDSLLSDDILLDKLPSLQLPSLKHLNKERPKMITKRKPTRPKRVSAESK